MRLLYVFPEEFTGHFAREYHVYRLAESLASGGCDVTLVAASSTGITAPSDLQNLFGGPPPSGRLKLLMLPRLFPLGPLKIKSGAWFYFQLNRLLASLHFDLTYTMHLKAADHLQKKHPLLPLVFEAHEIFADSYPERSDRYRQLTELEKRVYGKVRGVVAISPFLGQTLKTRYRVHVPLRVQHDGIDESLLLQPAENPSPHELIYMGSLQPWKGVPIAVSAMRLLPEFHLTVVGGSEKPLEALRENAPRNVSFTGHLARTELPPLLQKAAIGLIPNLLEPTSALYTFPLKLLEYSAAGKGIVASRIPTFDSLDAASWVRQVPSGSAEAIAVAVRALSESGHDDAAAQAWARQFLWPRQGEALKVFLESLLI